METGFIHIDTAACMQLIKPDHFRKNQCLTHLQLSGYENEESVGIGLRESGLARSSAPLPTWLILLTVRLAGPISTLPQSTLPGMCMNVLRQA